MQEAVERAAHRCQSVTEVYVQLVVEARDREDRDTRNKKAPGPMAGDKAAVPRA